MNKSLRLNIDYSDFTHHIDSLLKDHPNKDALLKFISNALWHTDCGAELFLEFMLTNKGFPALPKSGTFGYVKFDTLWLGAEQTKRIKEHKVLLEDIYMPCIVTEVASLASNYPVKFMYICDISNVTEDNYYDIITDRSSCRLDQFEKSKDERGFKELLLNKL